MKYIPLDLKDEVEKREKWVAMGALRNAYQLALNKSLFEAITTTVEFYKDEVQEDVISEVLVEIDYYQMPRVRIILGSKGKVEDVDEFIQTLTNILNAKKPKLIIEDNQVKYEYTFVQREGRIHVYIGLTHSESCKLVEVSRTVDVVKYDKIKYALVCSDTGGTATTTGMEPSDENQDQQVSNETAHEFPESA